MTDLKSRGTQQHDGTTRPGFLDSRSASAIEWPHIWSEIQPASSYGKRYKRVVHPYLPGQECECTAALKQLQGDLAVMDGELLQQARQSLQSLPDIEDLLSSLANAAKVLTAKELLLMKGFAFIGRELVEAVTRLRWSEADSWQTLLTIFGDTETRVFGVEHVAGAEYRELTRQIWQRQGAMTSETRSRDAFWHEQTGIRPNRDGLLVLPLPSSAAMAADCKGRAGLRWLRDTPFESVFEVLPTETMQDLKAQADAGRQALDEMEAGVFKRLTLELRNRLSAWNTCVREVTELDWRLAKVALARKWDATVPELGDDVQVREAVHPLISQRLAQKGGRYVPLVFAPQAGVNVLCGSNMGGKTVAMSLLSICQVLLQFGLPVPAKGFRSRLFDCVRFCQSAETDAVNGLSSFGTEMVRVKEAWEDMERVRAAMVCFDEPGRSTNPTEGEALVVGLVRSARKTPAMAAVVLIATHFPAPVAEEGVAKYKVRGVQANLLETEAALDCEPDVQSRLRQLEQAMDYRIEPYDEGSTSQEALRIAGWLGVPETILAESRHFLRRGKRL